MVIIFNVPEARTQLLEKDVVYTYRWTPRKKIGADWANSKRCAKKIADVYIEDYGETRCDEEALEPFAAESGFNDVNAWIKKILEKANPHGYSQGHLYKVTRRSQQERMRDGASHDNSALGVTEMIPPHEEAPTTKSKGERTP